MGEDRHVRVEEFGDRSDLVISVPSRFLRNLAIIMALPILAAAVVFVARFLARLDVVAALVTIGITGLAGELVRRLVSIPRRHRMSFRKGAVQVNGRSWRLDEIETFSLSDAGGSTWDPGSMPMPRDTTIGWHVFMRHGSRDVPVTGAMARAQAEAVLANLEKLMRRYG